jgi:hypothetical protein
MAFKAPAKPLKRGQPLTAHKGMASKGMARKPLAGKAITPEQKREQDKAALQKRTLRALDKARRLAAEQGVDLSDWEDEFLNSVSQRVRTYGRAFSDPDKGAMNGTLSLRQGVKLREIQKKAKKPKGERPETETPDED